jgi:hypothetical protein
VKITAKDKKALAIADVNLLSEYVSKTSLLMKKAMLKSQSFSMK